MHSQQQQNNHLIRAVRTRRLNLNAAQKEALEAVFRSELQPNFALGAQRGKLVNGVPAEFRNYIWTQLIPNHHGLTPLNYSQLLQQLATYRGRQNAERDSPQFSSPRKQQRQPAGEGMEEKKQEQNPEALLEAPNKIMRWIDTISQDIPRTFPELRIFHNDEEQREKLSNILGCFALYRPDVGYIQGLSLIGALFLQEMNNEYRAFTALANLITNNAVLYEFYAFNEATRDAMSSNITKKLEETNPLVAQALGELKVDVKMVMMEWVMTLFCRVFQLDSIPNIWDILFAHRLTNSIVEDLCVAVIAAHQEDILKATEPALVGKLLRNTRLSFSEEEEVFSTLRSLELASE